MLKKISFLISMPFTGILLLMLIISMSLATFVESIHGANAAWALIYDTWWFEAIFVLVLINLIGNIITSKLYRKSKLTVFVFHIAFIVIIVGAGITRFISSEGIMHIREGSTSSSIVSSDTYMDIRITDGDSDVSDSKKIRLSALTPKKFSWKGKVNGKIIKIKSVDYIPNASMQYVGAPGGEPFVQLVLFSGSKINVGLTNGEVRTFPGVTLSLNNSMHEVDFAITSHNDTLTAVSKFPVTLMSMGGGDERIINPGEPFILERGFLLSYNDIRIVLQRYMSSAKLEFVHSGNSDQETGFDVVKLEVNMDGMTSEFYVQGMANLVGKPNKVNMGSTGIECSYGSRNIRLPFSIKLEDFRIDRYPGSNSPSSFESDVTLIDKEKNINELHNIYMNNVLKHRGYRFYQSSYDQDELGTILSVNKDALGTKVTYMGYFFLALGMIMSLFAKGTRFAKLSGVTGKKNAKIPAIILLLIFTGFGLYAQNYPAPSKEVASEFGTIWVQGKEGRFKPMNTLSNEVMRKIVKKTEYEGYNADQVLLGMIVYPEQWKHAPLFKIKNPEINQIVGFKGEYVSFNDFISEDGTYILSDLVNTAYQKRVQDRNELDKEVMKLDEKVNVFYMVQTGSLLKIYPDPASEDGKWNSVADLIGPTTNETDTLGQVFMLYTNAIQNYDREMTDEIVNFLKNYQKKNSQHELHQGRKKAEILYNKINLFNRLIKFYALFGITLLIFQFLRIFKPSKGVEITFRIALILLIITFALHTVFMGIRWYISGHAPLTNGYESMIFISWITLLAGIIFAKKTGFTVAMTAILATFAMLVAHMSWMNPDITNLVPVLKSYWLTIHVTVIMSSYGFMGLSMLMGLINLVFYALLNGKNKDKISNVITQITIVNQMSVIIGLYFLTIGTFLGGVWANESWGRYWGWDPKETWALISVLVYSFIAHMHMFPGMKGSYSFNQATVIGYLSIMMTYFGVNYFLGGIHSYAAGAAFDIPIFVYIVVLLLIAVSIIAYKKQKFLTELPNSEK